MPDAMNYITVAVALPVHGVFTYAVPDELIILTIVGKRVLVPFGHRRVTGYVLQTSADAEIDEVKEILDILDDWPLFPDTMVGFFQWVAEYYKYPIGLVIKNALPGGLYSGDYAVLSITQAGRHSMEQGILTSFEKKVLRHLDRNAASIKNLERRMKIEIPKASVFAMLNSGWITQSYRLRKDRVLPKLERFVSLVETAVTTKKISASRQKLLNALKTEKELSVKHLKTIVPGAARLVKSMAASGTVRIFEKQVYRDPFGEPVIRKDPPQLTLEQKRILEKVKPSLGKTYTTFLLEGVTGSGKTEVYLQLALKTIQQGLSVIVLVPEIALISQMEGRFRARFGDRIAILHSGLSAGERYDQWLKISRAQVQIAIGARSAIFAPFQKIGLIIVDEEHDTSYKQESTLRYNARDLAVVRAKQQQAVALLGSATPSIQSYHNAVTRKFTKIQLTKRVEQRRLPDITIVDLSKLRNERGYRKYFSENLLTAMGQTLERGEQTILFLNRRGFSSLPICGSCGEPVQCKNCDISLTFHRGLNVYRCHYCGYTTAVHTRCHSCGSANIRHLGFGTEKIEAIANSLFPEKKIVRMDRDTISRKGAILRILKGLKNQSIDILIGTQMVAKGHDYPNITLVGIICADLSLNFPDFRAGEQTFQLLAQVSGRAGRGDQPGKVILQTYNPEHFSITCAKTQDIGAFYDKEIEFRKTLAYPPFSRMAQIIITSRDKGRAKQQARYLAALCDSIFKEDPILKRDITVMGPLEAPYGKIASNYRWQILLKGIRAQSLHTFVNTLLVQDRAVLNNRQIKTTIDVDPFYMM